MYNQLLVKNTQVEQLLSIIESDSSCLDSSLHRLIKLSIGL